MEQKKQPRSGSRKLEPPRPLPLIVEQLHDLLKVKKSAQATTSGDFADLIMFDSILRQEESLYDELRTALGRKQPRQKKTG